MGATVANGRLFLSYEVHGVGSVKSDLLLACMPRHVLKTHAYVSGHVDVHSDMRSSCPFWAR